MCNDIRQFHSTWTFLMYGSLLLVVYIISKPQLFNWKMCLVSEETAVLTRHIVILITVTNKTYAYAWIIHPACADLLPIPRWCSSPVVYSIAIAWHPPSEYFVRFIFKQLRVSAFILYELFTAWGNSSEFCQLRKTCSCITNETFVTTWRFASIHQRSDFRCRDLWRSRQLHSCQSCHRWRYKVVRLLYHLDQWRKYHLPL